jgi:hypothetical protein
MNKINSLEKTATLWHDGSKFALKLQKDLESLGYVINFILTGSQTPILDYRNRFLSGYGDIQSLIDREKARKD